MAVVRRGLFAFVVGALILHAPVAWAGPPTCNTDTDCGAGTYCDLTPGASPYAGYCRDQLGSGIPIPSDHGECSSVCTAGPGCTAAGDPARPCSAGACDAYLNVCGIGSGQGCPSDPNRCSHGLCNNISHTCAQSNGNEYCEDNTWCAANNCDPDNHSCGLSAGVGPCNGDPTVICQNTSLVCNTVTNTCAYPNEHRQWPEATDNSCNHDSQCEINLCDPDNYFCGYGSGYGQCSDANASTVCAFGVCGPLSRKCMNQLPNGCARDIDCTRFAGQNFCWWGQNPGGGRTFTLTTTLGMPQGSGFYCTQALENGVPIPADGMPWDAVSARNGTCTAQNANPACKSGMCNPIYHTCAGPVASSCMAANQCVDNVCGNNQKCGLAPGEGPCVANSNDVLCQSGVCGPNALCGLLNGAPCHADSLCQSGVCGADGACGYPNGQGPCTPDDGAQICRSMLCGGSGHCAGSLTACATSSDCLRGFYCDTSQQLCVPQLGAGEPIPEDPPYRATCSGTTARDVCLLGACNPQTHTCAKQNGLPCTDDKQCVANTCGTNGLCGRDVGQSCQLAAASSCQSQVCGALGFCIPRDSCRVDADCPANQWCNETGVCQARLPNGTAMMALEVGSSTQCTAQTAAARCISGLCNSASSQCAASNATACTSASTCASNVCHLDGLCGLPANTTCPADNVCRSGKCAGGVCTTPEAVASGHGLFSCAATHGPPDGSADGLAAVQTLLLGSAALALRRRRGLGALLLVASLSLPAASVAADTQPGFGLDVLTVGETGTRWIAADSLHRGASSADPSSASGLRSLVFRLDADYAHDPLVVRLGNNFLTHVVSKQAGLVMGGSYFVLPELRLNLSVPLQVYATGESGTDNDHLLEPPFHRAAIGDVRLGATFMRATPLGEALRLGLTARLRTPSGVQNSYTGHGTTTVSVLATAAGDYQWLAYALSIGTQARSRAAFANVVLGTQLLAVGAVGWQNADRSLLVGLEVPLSTVVVSNAFTAPQSNVDPLLGVHWWPLQQLGFHAAAGLGLTTGLGEPQWRAHLAAQWAPLASPRPPAAPILPPPAAAPAAPIAPAPSTETPGPTPPAPTDEDHDGVPDDADACPHGEPGDPNIAGCTELDSDGDGLADRVDSCPQQPGPAANHGCAQAQQVSIQSGKLVLDGKIEFETGRDALTEKSKPLLDDLVAVLVAHPEVSKVQIEGHTDSTGRPDKNIDLSQRRAEAVMKYAVDHGIGPARLVAKGFGGAQPIDSNASPLGRAANRRVQFIIVATTTIEAAP